MERSNFPDEYLGKEVIVTSHSGAIWRGKAVGFRREPSVLIEMNGGHRAMLPADDVRLVEPPKPWHDAKPGEVWVIKLENGTECAATREYGLDFKLSYGNLMQPRDERIIAGRRIWPEVVES